VKSLVAGLALIGCAAQADDFAAARERLVAELERYAAIAGEPGGDGWDPAVLRAVGNVERHEFVPPDQKQYAYENRPLPIGQGQTISQPYIVALMTDLIDLQPGDKVLEVGTGSGYQAAILAEIADQVFTIEIVESLYETATARLGRLGYDNISTRLGDGYEGWPEQAPFDAIVVTAAPEQVPLPLVQQLAKGGRMVIPVGDIWSTQQLLLITRSDDDEIVTRAVAPVRFVPLTGEH